MDITEDLTLDLAMTSGRSIHWQMVAQWSQYLITMPIRYRGKITACCYREGPEVRIPNGEILIQYPFNTLRDIYSVESTIKISDNKSTLVLSTP